MPVQLLRYSQYIQLYSP